MYSMYLCTRIWPHHYPGNALSCHQIWHHKWANGAKCPRARCGRGFQNREAGGKGKRRRRSSDGEEEEGISEGSDSDSVAHDDDREGSETE